MPPARAGILLSELCHVVTALSRISGRHVTQVWVPRPHLVVLAVGKELLHLEVAPVPRLHTTQHRPAAPPAPLSFQGMLRARMVGHPVEIRAPGGDRIVDLWTPVGVLHARLFGRGGGIWWTEGDEVIGASHGPARSLPPPAPLPRDELPPRFQPDEGEDWASAAARWFEQRAAQVAQLQRREAARRAAERRLGALQKLLRHLEEDLAASLGADALRQAADGLAAVVHRVSRGESRVEVPNLHTGEGVIVVSLDPGTSPSMTLRKMYDRAGRLERAQDHIIERIATAEEEQQRLRGQLDMLAELDDEVLLRLVALAPKQPPPASAEVARAGWWTWLGPGGQVVRIGRDAPGNHALVFRAARGRDWWLHLRDAPSAHVVIGAPDGKEPTDRVLAAAAELLLHASHIPDGVLVDLRLCKVSDLRPVPKGRPGEVIVTRERVLSRRRDPTNLHGWIRMDSAEIVPPRPKRG